MESILRLTYGRFPLARRQWGLLIAAGALILYFAVAMVLWGMEIRGTVHTWRMARHPYVVEDLLRIGPRSGQCLVLLLASAIALVLFVRRSCRAKAVLLSAVILACAAFTYDVARQRYDIEVGIATQDYWDSGAQEHIYITWWWYNDRWWKSKPIRSDIRT